MHSGSFYIWIHCEMAKLVVFCRCRPSDSIKWGKKKKKKKKIFFFFFSFAANVVAHCICKWLDEQFKAGKH